MDKLNEKNIKISVDI